MSAPMSELFRVFGRIGLMSFGGPAGQIALMHRELVEQRDWLSEDQFLRGLSFCMLLPGPEAMQLATYAGWKLNGVKGGVLAGLLFVLPGAAVIAALALAYAQFGAQPETQALMMGIKAAVIVIVAQAMIKLSSKALKGTAEMLLALAAFVALFVFALPFPLVIAAAACVGYIRADGATAVGPRAPPMELPLRTIVFWLVLWLLPLGVLYGAGQSLLFDLGVFFAKLAVVTFGGAYAVLAYMAQEVVQVRGWLDAPQMVDALGLAETTPGPLILVTQFVGMLAGHTQGGWAVAVAAGIVTLWMTFVPCFLWIFAGAPLVDTLVDRPKLSAALAAITAAVVGVIANLSLWFAFHVLFDEVRTVDLGLMGLTMPVFSSLIWQSLPLVGLAAVLLGPLRRGVLLTLICCATAGLVLHALW